jgi:hypothetical protein
MSGNAEGGSERTELVLRQLTNGWQAVAFLGCEMGTDGYPNRSTADQIIKRWGLTRSQAKVRAQGEASR